MHRPRLAALAAALACVCPEGKAVAAESSRVLLDWIFDTYTFGANVHGFGGELGRHLGWGGGLTMELGLAFPRKLTGLDGLETALGFRGAFSSRGERPITIDGETVEGGIGSSAAQLALRYRFPLGRLAFYPLAGVSLAQVRERHGPATGFQPGWLLGTGVDWKLTQLANPAGSFVLELLVRGEVVYERLDFEEDAPGLVGEGLGGGVYFVAKWDFRDPFGDLEEAF